jgi:hypothetical protein
MTCSNEGCTRKRGRRKVCESCRMKARRAAGKPLTSRTCSEKGCDRPHDARGLCNMHYHRVLRAEQRDGLRAFEDDPYAIAWEQSQKAA